MNHLDRKNPDAPRRGLLQRLCSSNTLRGWGNISYVREAEELN